MSAPGIAHLLPAETITQNGVTRRPRLLVVQPLVGIGDMVWHKPWIDHLATGYDVILATKPTVKGPILFTGDDGVGAFVMIERSMRGRKGSHDGFLGFWRMVAAFRAVRADACVILHHSARYALAAKLAGIPNRWGYGIGASARWLNRGRFLGREARYQHPTAKMAEFASLNGFAPATPVWQIATGAAAKAAANAFLAENGVDAKTHPAPIITFGVGAMDRERQWPEAAFANLVKRLSASYPALSIILMGAPSEQPVIDAVRAKLPEGLRVLTAVQPFDVAIELLRRSLLFVGNDSSLLNIAAACGRPSLGLFAQSPPLDYNANIRAVSVPDGRYGVPGNIGTITPDQVYAAIQAELQQIDESLHRVPNRAGNRTTKGPIAKAR